MGGRTGICALKIGVFGGRWRTLRSSVPASAWISPSPIPLRQGFGGQGSGYAGARGSYGRNVSMSPDYHLSPRKRSANCHIHVAGRRVWAGLLPPLAGGESASADSGGWVSYVASRPPPRIRKERILSPAVLGTEVSPHPASAKRILTSPDGRGNAARRAKAPPVKALHARIRVRKKGEIKSQFFVYNEQMLGV
jgi:hypothetical protein